MMLSHSDVKNLKECPGKGQFSHAMARVQKSGPARVGTGAHAVRAQYLEHLLATAQPTDWQRGSQLLESVASRMSHEEERELLQFMPKWLEAFSAERFLAADRVVVETRYYLRVNDLELSSNPPDADDDRLYFAFTADDWSTTKNRLVVGDAKSGRVIEHTADPATNTQLWAYAGAILTTMPDIDHVRLYLEHMRYPDVADECETPAGDIREWFSECWLKHVRMWAGALATWKTNGLPLQAYAVGTACAGCDGRNQCPVYNQRGIANAPGGNDPRHLLELAAWHAERAADAKKELRMIHEASGPIRVGDFETRLVPTTTVAIPLSSRPMLDGVLDPEVIESLFKASRTEIERSLRKVGLAPLVNQIVEQHGRTKTTMRFSIGRSKPARAGVAQDDEEYQD